MKEQKERLLGHYHNYVSYSTLLEVTKKLNILYQKNPDISPSKELIFNCFRNCNSDVKIVIINDKPYHDKLYATGNALANPINVKKESPELSKLISMIIREFPDYQASFCDLPFGDPYKDNFDITLNNWVSQDILLLNSSLTTQKDSPESHYKMWHRFMGEFLSNLSLSNSGIVFLLFGDNPKVIGKFINRNSNYVFEYPSISDYVRDNKVFECDGFRQAKIILKNNNNIKINWNV